jgi:hypothetical protein
VWFINDGAPAHFTRSIKQFLDSHYLDRWTGRNGPVLWPPRSPDLTPAHFYVWCHLKGTVYWKSQHVGRNLAFDTSGRDNSTTHAWNSWRHRAQFTFKVWESIFSYFVSIITLFCCNLINKCAPKVRYLFHLTSQCFPVSLSKRLRPCVYSNCLTSLQE